MSWVYNPWKLECVFLKLRDDEDDLQAALASGSEEFFQSEWIMGKVEQRADEVMSRNVIQRHNGRGFHLLVEFSLSNIDLSSSNLF